MRKFAELVDKSILRSTTLIGHATRILYINVFLINYSLITVERCGGAVARKVKRLSVAKLLSISPRKRRRRILKRRREKMKILRGLSCFRESVIAAKKRGMTLSLAQGTRILKIVRISARKRIVWH